MPHGRQDAGAGEVGAWINGSPSIDQWIEEEQWLAGMPRARSEQFGRLWWQFS
jgi:hypothetical protein